MKNILYLCATLLCLAYSCNYEDQDQKTINYVAFETTSYDFGVDIQGSNSNDIKVYTTTISNSERSFNISVLTDLSTADPASYSVPSSVTVPSNVNVGSFTVNVSDLNISPDGETLVLAFSDEDDVFIGDPMTLNIKQICPYPEVVLDITFDDFPEEQYWELYDANNVLLFEGGPYPEQTEFNRAFCLESGTYKIVMGDTFGDGGGAYTMSYNGTVIVSGDGNHGFSEEKTFQLK